MVEGEIKDLPLKKSLFYILWLMNCPENSKATTRLRLISSLAEVIQRAAYLRRNLADFEDLQPSEVTVILDKVPNLAIYAVYLDSGKAALKGILSRYLSSLQHIKTSISGKDLQKSGLAPGPHYTEILSRLRNAWLDGEVSSAEEEQALLQELLEEAEGGS